MPEQSVLVTVTSGESSTSAEGHLQRFSPGQRTLRVLAVLGIGMFLAAMLIPIPIIHLVGIPLALIVTILAAIKQGASTGRLRPLRINCPRCHGANRLGGGFGYRSVDEPIHVDCEDCRRELTVEFKAKD